LLPEQSRAQEDADLLRENFETNCLAPGILLEQAATAMKAQDRGNLLAIGSVAGDRGRAVNYAYGSAKGALEILLSGLRQRLHGSGIQVSLVKPGFVDTPMTSHFPKGLLWSSPDRVASDCIRALRKGRAVTYSPWYWAWILRVIRGLPRPIFDRLRF
jgi:short-subunit dehydrogenase